MNVNNSSTTQIANAQAQRDAQIGDIDAQIDNLSTSKVAEFQARMDALVAQDPRIAQPGVSKTWLALMSPAAAEYYNIERNMPNAIAQDAVSESKIESLNTQKAALQTQFEATIQTLEGGAEMLRAAATKGDEAVGGISEDSSVSTRAFMCIGMSHQIQENLLKDQMDQIQDDNKDTAETSELMAQLRILRPPGPGTEGTASVSEAVLDRLEELGVKVPPGKDMGDGTVQYSKSDCDTLLENCKARQDSAGSLSQQSMQQLQLIMNKLSELSTALSSTMKTDSDQKQSIARDL